MPQKKTLKRARRHKRQGKSPSTQAGEFVREEIDDIRAGKHGARSAKQAIAIGLSKARRAGVKLPPPRKGKASAETRRKARKDLAVGARGASRKPNPRRARAAKRALERESTAAASPTALARQAKSAARKRGPADRRRSARKAARTRARRKSAAG
jgi:hypothetical protein